MGSSRRPIIVSATGRAVEEFDQAAQELPRNLEFRKRRADALAELKDRSGAVKEYAEVAAAYRRQGQYEEAIRTYGNALDLKPEKHAGRLHVELAETLASAGRRDEALAEFKEAFKCEPNEWHTGVAWPLSAKQPGPGPRPERPIPRRSS